MKRLFGVSRKDAPAKPSLEDAQGRMEARGDKLDDRLRHIDDELSKIAVEIKRAQGPSKQRLTQKATMLLKQRKAYDTHRSQLYQQQFTLDQLQFTIETVRDTKDQIAVMKDATKGLRKEFKKMDISEISKLHDEMDDLMRDSNDIQDILGEAYGDVEDFDDEEVAAELDVLAGQVALESDSSYLDVALKHSIPKSSLPNNKRSESDGLKGEEATDVHRLEQQLGL